MEKKLLALMIRSYTARMCSALRNLSPTATPDPKYQSKSANRTAQKQK